MTHQSLSQVYQQRFFGPLGLHHTFYSDDFYPQSIVKQMATAVPNGPGTQSARTDFNAGLFGPAGGMIMNSQDLLTWTADLFTPGKVLSKASIQELEATITPPYTPPRPQNAAYGLGVFSLPVQSGLMWWYTGVIDGYTSFFGWIPAKQELIVAQAASWPGSNFAILFPNQPLLQSMIKSP